MSLDFSSLLQDPQGVALAESQTLAQNTSEGVLDRTGSLWQELRHGGADPEDCWEIVSGGVSDHFRSIVDTGLGLAYDITWSSQRIKRGWQDSGWQGLGQALLRQAEASETWRNAESKIDFVDALIHGQGSRLDAGLYLFHEVAQVQLERLGQANALSPRDIKDSFQGRPDRILDRQFADISSRLEDKSALSTAKEILRGETDLSAQKNVDFSTLGIRAGVVVALSTLGRGAGSKIARRLLAFKPVQAQLTRLAGTWGPGIVSGLEIGAAVSAGAGIEFTGQGLIATRQGIDWKSFAKHYWSDPKVWLKLGFSTLMLGGLRYFAPRAPGNGVPPPGGHGQSGGDAISVIQTGAGTRPQPGATGATSRAPSSTGGVLVLTQPSPSTAAAVSYGYDDLGGESLEGYYSDGVDTETDPTYDWRSTPQEGDCSRFVATPREERLQIAQSSLRATVSLACIRNSTELDPNLTALELWEENPRISFQHNGSPMVLSFRASFWVYAYNHLEKTNAQLKVRNLAEGTEQWVAARQYVEGRSPEDLWDDPALVPLRKRFIEELSQARGEAIQRRIEDAEVEAYQAGDRADDMIRTLHRGAQEAIEELARENEQLRQLLERMGIDPDEVLNPNIVPGSN